MFPQLEASCFSQVHNILAEMVMGGMVLETNMNEIITQVDAQNKMEKSEVGPSCLSACAYDSILPPHSEVPCPVLRHVCMLQPACSSPATLWMLPTYDSLLFVLFSLAFPLTAALLPPQVLNTSSVTASVKKHRVTVITFFSFETSNFHLSLNHPIQPRKLAMPVHCRK